MLFMLVYNNFTQYNMYGVLQLDESQTDSIELEKVRINLRVHVPLKF